MTEAIFTSDRLGYRLYQENDLADLIQLDNDPEVRAFFPMRMPTPEEIKINIQRNIQYFLQNHYGVFIAVELATGEFVGRCGFKQISTGEIEVGYVFLKKFWGQGLATEALNALLAWAKENISIDKIIAFTPIEHKASERVMQKCGMEYYKQAIMYGVPCIFYQKTLRVASPLPRENPTV